MKRIKGFFSHGEKGFTLIEMLIVIAVLGVLAGVVVPNVASFTKAGNIAAANSEAANVKTAALAYLAEYGVFPGAVSGCTTFEGYLSSAPDGVYTFSTANGLISVGTAGSGITAGLAFSNTTQKWSRAG